MRGILRLRCTEAGKRRLHQPQTLENFRFDTLPRFLLVAEIAEMLVVQPRAPANAKAEIVRIADFAEEDRAEA